MTYLETFFIALILFLVLYFGFGLVTWFCTSLLSKNKIGEVIDDRPLRNQQIKKEIGYSISSVFVFACFGVLTKWLLEIGVVHYLVTPLHIFVCIEIMILFFWNELHFYVCHRLLHSKFLYRHVHVSHHRSTIPTPFSTYSFHYIEAIMLGSVMVSAMLVYNFHVISLLSLPLMSIFFNALGHSNYDAFPKKNSRHFLSFSKRHSLHHSKSTGNYGFFLPVLDWVFKTGIKK